MITKRDTKHLALALEESIKSTYQRVKIGAVIAQGNKVISKGANLSTSHPMQRWFNDRAGRVAPCHNLHAEMNAIVKSKGRDLRGTTIYVARVDRSGAFGMCRPCPACECAIRARGITRVIYFTPSKVQEEQY